MLVRGAGATGLRSETPPSEMAVHTRSERMFPEGHRQPRIAKVPSLGPRHQAPLSTRRSLTAYGIIRPPPQR